MSVVVRFCAVLALLVVVGGTACGRAAEKPDIAALADVAAEFGATTAMAFGRGPDGTVEIDWAPAYRISDHGDEPFLVKDLTLQFPGATDSTNGKQVDLVKARAMTTVKIYRSSTEIENDRASSTEQAPVRLDPGETLYLQPDEALMVVEDGRPVPLRTDVQAVAYLGPLLQLPKRNGGYGCVIGATLTLTVSTDHGDLVRPVRQALLPAGCLLNVPKP